MTEKSSGVKSDKLLVELNCGEAQRSADLLKRILIHQKVVNQSTKSKEEPN